MCVGLIVRGLHQNDRESVTLYLSCTFGPRASDCLRAVSSYTLFGPRLSTNGDLKVWTQVEKSFCNFLFPICAEQSSRAIEDMAASSAAGSGSSPCPCSTPLQIYGGRAQPPEARARAHHAGAGLHMRACETIRCAGASCHEAQRRHAAKKVQPQRRRRHV